MEFGLTKIEVNNLPTIEFKGYDKLVEDILKLSEEMKKVEVTEDSIKTNRELLARVRKEFKTLDQERIAVKKEVMKPYSDIEEKIKYLGSILKEGEQAIDSQIKAFDEKQREERKKDLQELFSKYQQAYNSPQWLSFEMLLDREPVLLTKSISQSKIKDKVIGYFEQFKQDYANLKKQVPEKTERTAVLLSYQRNGLNMELAITEYMEMVAEKERLENELAFKKQTKVPDLVFVQDIETKPKEVEYVTIKIKKEDLPKIKVGYEVIK